MTTTIRHALVSALLALVTAAGARAAEPPKVLKLAFRTAETGFDPAKVNDIYSLAVLSHILEGLYAFDYLAQPARIKPRIADGMPVPADDYKTWTIRIRPGIYFADDPAFKGQKREVVAQDFIYAIQRHADPATKSPSWGVIDASGSFVGLAEQRKRALDSKKPFDYDAPIEGMKTLDRHTLQFKTREPRPRLVQLLSDTAHYGAVAREVVEFYGDKIDAHPVGTGPFRLKEWRRSSAIVLERNPTYRDERWDAEPAADDADGQAMLSRLKGRPLPLVDQVRISIIEEAQPFWLAFRNAEIDTAVSKTGAVPGEFINQAAPNGQLAPNLARLGIRMRRQANADSAYTYFNMEDPVVGGYTPEKVALRRAIGLSVNVGKLIRIGYRGQAIPSQSMLVPHTSGYDPQFKSEMGDYDPARARALLDLYGYVDRDGDGYRELPDGKPLLLDRASSPGQIEREFEELWKKDMNDVGLRTRSSVAQWPEQLKAARAGKLQMWALGGSANVPDGIGSLQRFDSAQAGGQNLARFKSAEYDAIHRELARLPDGPEREAMFRKAQLIGLAYMPYKGNVHRISTDLWHPWIDGVRRPTFANEWWHMVDVDNAKRPNK
jgi:ABC-type transport system substrate-binding protein